MATELEAKFRVESHGPVRERLRAIRAESLGAVIETNIILDSADGSLRRRGSGLRIRSALPVDGGTARVTLTYKGPLTASVFKSREEIEVSLGDAELAVGLLAALGFVSILCYEKRRESWRIGECLVELDTPAAIGRFLEIEGPSVGSIRSVRDELGLSAADHVRESYVRLLMAHCAERGLTDRTLTLDAGDRAPWNVRGKGKD